MGKIWNEQYKIIRLYKIKRSLHNFKKGLYAENKAKKYLQKQGLYFITSRFKTKCGEIDLIMSKDETIVFVEVKIRTNNQYGDAIEYINKFKQKKIIRTAKLFCQYRQLEQHFLRFDTVTIDSNNKITWIKNAFIEE